MRLESVTVLACVLFLAPWSLPAVCGVPIREPHDTNPPAKEVEGKVRRVSGKWVEIDLGTDNGIKEGNTVEVYRLQPRPDHVGTIRITDARHHVSVGYLVLQPDAGRDVGLKEGDIVAPRIK